MQFTQRDRRVVGFPHMKVTNRRPAFQMSTASVSGTSTGENAFGLTYLLYLWKTGPWFSSFRQRQ